jgi:hypothetical protein
MGRERRGELVLWIPTDIDAAHQKSRRTKYFLQPKAVLIVKLTKFALVRGKHLVIMS